MLNVHYAYIYIYFFTLHFALYSQYEISKFYQMYKCDFKKYMG